MISTTKLIGRAFYVTRYREIENWATVKQLLINAFKTPYAAETLQIELNLIRIQDNETVGEYTNRVDDIFQKICNANVLNKSESDAMVIRKNTKQQALFSYVNMLIQNK